MLRSIYVAKPGFWTRKFKHRMLAKEDTTLYPQQIMGMISLKSWLHQNHHHHHQHGVIFKAPSTSAVHSNSLHFTGTTRFEFENLLDEILLVCQRSLYHVLGLATQNLGVVFMPTVANVVKRDTDVKRIYVAHNFFIG